MGVKDWLPFRQLFQFHRILFLHDFHMTLHRCTPLRECGERYNNPCHSDDTHGRHIPHSFCHSSTIDVSTEISNIIRTGNPEGYSPDTVKKTLNEQCAPRMTMQLLHERYPEDDVLGWLRDIPSIAQE